MTKKSVFGKEKPLILRKIKCLYLLKLYSLIEVYLWGSGMICSSIVENE